MFIETSKNLYECGADIIITITSIPGDCHPGHSINAQCIGAASKAQRVYNELRPHEHWGHCYVTSTTCYLRESRHVLVALCMASVRDNQRSPCYADHERLRSALKELNQWIEDSGHDFTICMQKFCGARWNYEWKEIMQILEETIGNRTVYLCRGFNTTDPIPDPDAMARLQAEITKPFHRQVIDFFKSLF